MSSIKSLVEERAVVQVLGELVQAYEVAYVAKIGKTRDDVLAQRVFVEGLTKLYNEMKYAYRKEVEALLRHKSRSGRWLLGGRKKKSAAVLLSSSRRLAGEINQKVFGAFWDYIQSHDCDVIIVGSWAKEVYLQRGGDSNFVFFEMPDMNLTTEDLQPVLEKLLEYEGVQIFRGKYVSLINQVESMDTLGGVEAVEKEVFDERIPAWFREREVEARQIGYLFEPSLKDILDFFDREIFASWLHQTSSEAGLAQMGSRISTLESAIDNIDKRLHGLTYERRKLIKRRKNKRQLQSLAGMSFWHAR